MVGKREKRDMHMNRIGSVIIRARGVNRRIYFLF
jgi:hypothetical protein